MRPGFDLLIITDGRPQLLPRLERALARAEPGRVAVVMREPHLRTAELVALGRAMRSLTDGRGVLLLVSDRIDIAQAIDADGVQLPEAGFAPDVARSLLGKHALIGVSRHSAEGLREAAARGASFATLSPVHRVDGKAPPLGIPGFAVLSAQAKLPVYALGGVRLEDVPALRTAHARGVAVMREVLSAEDPGLSTKRLLDAWTRY